jgi:hypothetical protein
MKFPSVKLLAQDTIGVLKRFPLEITSTLVGTISGTISIHLTKHNYNTDISLYVRLIMAANLGLLLNLAVTLFSESRKLNDLKKWLYHAAACAVIAVLFFILNPFDNGTADFIRFALVSLGLHLLVSFAGFTDKGHINGFWQFNKALFLRILASALYGVVLFLGLAAALGAMNFLFNTDFKYDVFLTLWAWITGMFITIFFLAGVPADINGLDEDNTYPKALKIFTQYVLIPLATVYVIILLAYEVKILIEWRLPKGMVSDMILGYAVFGILSLLLLYPIRNLEENRWLKTFARSFYFLMIPLVILLFVAIGTRIFKYGITEYRYFLILLSCWLFAITVYFLTSKKQNIKLIPVSLCVLSLLAVYGPQSAFSVSMYSQRHGLVTIFKKYGAFENGKLTSLKNKKVSKRDGNQSVAILDYLITDHDFTSLQPYLNRDLKFISDSLSKEKNDSGKIVTVDKYHLPGKKLDWAKEYLGVTRFHWNRYGNFEEDAVEDEVAVIYLNTQQSNVTEVKGYDYTISSVTYRGQEEDTYKNLKYVQTSNDSTGVYTITLNGEKHVFNITALEQQFMDSKNLSSYRDKGNDNSYVVPLNKLNLSDTSKNYIVTFKLERLQFNKIIKTGRTHPTDASGTYYIKALK